MRKAQEKQDIVRFVGPQFEQTREREPEQIYEAEQRRTPTPSVEEEPFRLETKADFALALGEYLQGRLSDRFEASYAGVDSSIKLQIINKGLREIMRDITNNHYLIDIINRLTKREIGLTEGKQLAQQQYQPRLY